MAAPRQSTSRPVVNTRSDILRGPAVAFSSRPNTLTTVEEAPRAKPNEAVLRADDYLAKNELKLEAERRTVFETESNKIFNIPDGYQRVEVLLIRWDESIDDFTGHNAEIQRLYTVFSIGYGYNCTIAQISNRRNPQLALNIEIMNHIHQYDEEGTLLIVYYTGHGNQIVNGTDQCLELSACENTRQRDGFHIPTAVWDQAEVPLRTQAACDVLVILDCCFASTAALKSKNENLRTYQLLAASSAEGVTSGPGKTSFTTALCDSLEELLKELQGGSFSVLKLWDKINIRRPTEPALLWDRLKRHNNRSIKLGRLDSTPQRPARSQQELEKASLTLRLSLKVPDLRTEEIRSLAHHLPEACRNAGIPVRKMEWMEMKRRDPERTVRRAVVAFKRPIRTRSTPSMSQQPETPTVPQRRTQSNASVHPYEVSSPISQVQTMYLEPQPSTLVEEGLESQVKSFDTQTKGLPSTGVSMPDAGIRSSPFIVVTMCFLILTMSFSLEDRVMMALFTLGFAAFLAYNNETG